MPLIERQATDLSVNVLAYFHGDDHHDIRMHERAR